jgi:hypothetical protein
MLSLVRARFIATKSVGHFRIDIGVRILNCVSLLLPVKPSERPWMKLPLTAASCCQSQLIQEMSAIRKYKFLDLNINEQEYCHMYV